MRTFLPPLKRYIHAPGSTNRTIQLATFTYLVESVIGQVRKIREEALRRGAPRTEFIWRSQHPPHPMCARSQGPTPFAGQYPDDAPYNWGSFPAFDEVSRFLVAQSNENTNSSIHFMDLSMLYQRPDGHGANSIEGSSDSNATTDCLHC